MHMAPTQNIRFFFNLLSSYGFGDETCGRAVMTSELCCYFYILCEEHVIIMYITRGPGHLSPSSFAVCQCPSYFSVSVLLLHILIKSCFFKLPAAAQVVAFLFMVQSTHFAFPRCFLFLSISWLWRLSHLIYFLSLCICFSFFLYSHLKMTGAGWFLSMLWLKLNYYITPFHNVSLRIWPTAVIFLHKSFFFIFPQWQMMDGQLIECLLFIVLGLALRKWNLLNKLYRDLCCCRRMKQTFA
jgi:hypothetical protein